MDGDTTSTLQLVLKPALALAKKPGLNMKIEGPVADDFSVMTPLKLKMVGENSDYRNGSQPMRHDRRREHTVLSLLAIG